MTQDRGKSDIHKEAGRHNDVVDRGVAAADDALAKDGAARGASGATPDLKRAERAGREGGSR